MDFHTGKTTRGGKSFYFEITVGPQPETVESYAIRILAVVGLKNQAMIKAFTNFSGSSLFDVIIRDARNNAEIIAVLKNPQGKITHIKVHVFPAVVDNLKLFGINLLINGGNKATFNGHAVRFAENVKKYQNFTPAPVTPVSQWRVEDKLGAVIRRAALLLPEDVGKELLKLLDPLALAAMAVVVVIWAFGHFWIASEIVDVILLLLGVLALGSMAFEAAENLIIFATKTISATSEEDLDEAAKHLAEAIAQIGVQTVLALLLAKAPKVFREPKVLMDQPNPSITLTIKTIGEPPVTKGKFFYELPEIEVAPKHPYAERTVPGRTDQWGNSTIYPGRNSSLKDIEIAKFHEEFHRFLSPKLQIFRQLRQIRAVIRMNSYLKSYLLRYLEEALAETTAQIRVRGFKWKNILEGVKFPVGEESYVTISKMGIEAEGVLLGPVNVGGMIFNAYFSDNEEW